MKLSRLPLIAGLALALALTGCATTDRGPVTLMSPTFTVVAGVALLDPGQVADVTHDAVRSDPAQAVLLTAFAVAAAPDYAKPILAAATLAAPEQTSALNSATKQALRRRSAPAWERIPDHSYLVRLVDRAESVLPAP